MASAIYELLRNAGAPVMKLTDNEVYHTASAALILEQIIKNTEVEMEVVTAPRQQYAPVSGWSVKKEKRNE